MGQNRRANAMLFGIDFQINAAIILMLENIKEMKTIHVESANEDIDIEMDNGKHILAQAKSVEKSSTDFRNVRENLKKALLTLSEGSHNVKPEKLIFITNSPNPLNEEESRSIFYGDAHRHFNTLPNSSQNIIKSYLSSVSEPLNPDDFMIQVLPFETDDERERYKIIWREIDNFVGSLYLNYPGLGKQLHLIWKNKLFYNGSQNEVKITLTKKSIIWPIIVLATDINMMDQDFRERFDQSVYDEVVHNYHNIIDTCCERFEFFSRILYDYISYHHEGNNRDKCYDFVDEYWRNYASDFEIDGMDPEVNEALSKIVIYNVIRRRYDINKIKQGVSL